MVDYAFENTRNDTIAVGTSSVIVSRSRTQEDGQFRKEMIIRNTSDDATKIITVNFGEQQATNNAGVVLRQNELINLNSELGNKCYQGIITAICAVAAGQLSVFER